MLATAVLTGALAVQAPDLARFEAVEAHMGTLVRVTVYTADEQTAARAFSAAFGRVAALERILSDYQPHSELSGVTRGPAGVPVPVSDDLFTVLDASQALAEASGGAFDITQGPIVRLWREARTTGRPPSAAALGEAAQRSGYRKLHLDARRRTVTVDTDGMALDVGGIGKGYAASQALDAIRALGVHSALVAVSGDLAFGEAPPGRRGWRVRIDGPASGPAGVPGVLELTNAAVSTSGRRTQHVDIDGRRHSHIVDPASGVGLTDDLSVTVIARGGLDADGLATAISVLGAARGLRLVESWPGASALVIRRTAGGTTAHPSARFPVQGLDRHVLP